MVERKAWAAFRGKLKLEQPSKNVARRTNPPEIGCTLLRSPETVSTVMWLERVLHTSREQLAPGTTRSGWIQANA